MTAAVHHGRKAGSRPSRLIDSGASAGFTLIEALAAFAIVAVLTLVVQRGLVQSRLGLAAMEDRVAAERVARSLLAEPVRASDVARGGREGIVDGHRFVMRLSPLDLPLPEAERANANGCPPGQTSCDPARNGGDPGKRVRWQPFRQDIEVVTLRGAPITVETIRLGQVLPGDAQTR